MEWRIQHIYNEGGDDLKGGPNKKKKKKRKQKSKKGQVASVKASLFLWVKRPLGCLSICIYAAVVSDVRLCQLSAVGYIATCLEADDLHFPPGCRNALFHTADEAGLGWHDDMGRYPSTGLEAARSGLMDAPQHLVRNLY